MTSRKSYISQAKFMVLRARCMRAKLWQFHYIPQCPSDIRSENLSLFSQWTLQPVSHASKDERPKLNGKWKSHFQSPEFWVFSFWLRLNRNRNHNDFVLGLFLKNNKFPYSLSSSLKYITLELNEQFMFAACAEQIAGYNIATCVKTILTEDYLKHNISLKLNKY